MLAQQERFTVSIDQAAYKALVRSGESANLPVNLQYLERLTIKDLLGQHSY